MASSKKEIDSDKNKGPPNMEERSIWNVNPFLSLKHPDLSSCAQPTQQLFCQSPATVADADSKGKL